MKPETTPEKMIADIVANRIHGEPESYAKAILSALSSAGFVIVPREPTPTMRQAGFRAFEAGLRDDSPESDPTVDLVYRAMLAAAESDDGK